VVCAFDPARPWISRPSRIESSKSAQAVADDLLLVIFRSRADACIIERGRRCLGASWSSDWHTPVNESRTKDHQAVHATITPGPQNDGMDVFARPLVAAGSGSKRLGTR
jgi:hypothetical protein